MWNGIIYDISDKNGSLKIVMKTNDKKLVFKILGYMIRKSTNAFSHFFCFVALSWETDENKDNETNRIREIFLMKGIRFITITKKLGKLSESDSF